MDWRSQYYRKIFISESGLPVNTKLLTFQMFLTLFRVLRDGAATLRGGYKHLYCVRFFFDKRRK